MYINLRVINIYRENGVAEGAADIANILRDRLSQVHGDEGGN